MARDFSKRPKVNGVDLSLDDHTIESHEAFEGPPRDGEAVSYEVSELDLETVTENFEDAGSLVFPFDSTTWQINDTEPPGSCYAFVENAVGNANNEANFTITVPDDASDATCFVELHSLGSDTNFRDFAVFANDELVGHVYDYQSFVWGKDIYLPSGENTLQIQYTSTVDGAPSVEEAKLAALTLSYNVPSEDSTHVWKTRGYAKKNHIHQISDITDFPSLSGLALLGHEHERIMPLALDSFAETDPVTSYPYGFSIMPVSEEANWWSNEAPAMVITYNITGIQLQHATWRYASFDDEWDDAKRVWNEDSEEWSSWHYQVKDVEWVFEQIAGASTEVHQLLSLPVDINAESYDISSFGLGITIFPVTGGANWGPNTGQAGVVLTERMNGDGKQTFTQFNGHVFVRTYTASTWGAWMEVVWGNDSRLTDARTPTAHDHNHIINLPNDSFVESDPAAAYPDGTSVFLQDYDVEEGWFADSLWGHGFAIVVSTNKVFIEGIGEGAVQWITATGTQRIAYRTWSIGSELWGEFSNVQIPWATSEYPVGDNGSIYMLTASTVPITATANRTGITMQEAQFPAQVVDVINRSEFTLTFDTTDSVSLVVGGGTIGPHAERQFVWDANYGGDGIGRWVSMPGDHDHIITLDRSSRLATDGPDEFPYGLSVMEADGSEGSWGWQVGIVHTTRILDTAANGYADADGAMQTFFEFTFNTLKRRNWRPDIAEWSDWKPEAEPTILPFNYADGDTNVGVYPYGVSVMGVSDDEVGWPTFTAPGPPANYYLTTMYRANSLAYQYAYYEENAYSRYFDTLDAEWTDWELINPKDAVAGTASLRTLGTGAQQAAAGNDSRLSNSRTPTAHAGTHTNGTDDIQNATTSQKGLATAAQITKLTDIETNATADHDASTSTKGVTKLSTAPVSGANPIAAGDNDSRLSDTRTPTDNSVTNAKVAGGAAIDESKLNLASDAVVGTASRRTIGTGAQQAAAGNDSRFTDQRTPSDDSVTNAKVAAAAAIAESKLNLASDAAVGTASRRTLGSGAQQAAPGNDSRLSDARTPTSHGSSHAWGGGDAVRPSIRAEQTIGASGAIAVGTDTEILLTATADRTGITVNTGGFDGQFVHLINRSAFTLTFNATEATSRVVGTGTVPPNSMVVLVWDADYGGGGVGRWTRITQDGAAAQATLRSLGTGSQQAAAGNDSRFTDQRTPSDSSVTNAKVAGAAAIDESKLNLASDAAAGTASRRTIGTSGTAACAGNDSRLSNARTPVQADEGTVGGGEVATQAETNAETDDTRFITPAKNAAASLSHRQYDTGASAVTAEGDTRYDSTRKILLCHDSSRERALTAVGFMPYAFPIGGSPTQAASATISMGIGGGNNVIPIVVEGHMLLQSVSVWTTDTTQTRGSLEFGLYEDRLDSSNTLNVVSGAVGSLAAVAATVAARRDIPVTSPPVYLAPGIYWLDLKCNGANANGTWTMGVTPAGVMTGVNTWQQKVTDTSALPSTLDMVAATWTKQATIPVVRLNGRVFGQSAAF